MEGPVGNGMRGIVLCGTKRCLFRRDDGQNKGAIGDGQAEG